MHTFVKTTLAMLAFAAGAGASAQITFYENERFEGRQFTTERQIDNLTNYGYNDRASSAVVLRDQWEVCDNARFGGRCVVLRAGRYPSLAAMDMNDRISSMRMISGNARLDNRRYAPEPEYVYDNSRRRGERLYDADVTSVRAVVGPPQQRCWMDREQVAQQPQSGNANVPAAIAGALLGGILGHQVGGGAGKDLATIGGVAAGGYVGSQIGRNNPPAPPVTRDVQRCETVASQAKPEFWDVTYNFRGLEHRIQTTQPPGATVRVNEQGEPRS